MSTVLVVDDSATDRCLVGGLLEKEDGLTVRFAESGAGALAEMENQVPELVVTDLMMPEMDGLELVATVRNKYPLVPVILITSRGNEEIAVKALQQGAASYVPKRSLARKLVDTIHGVLAMSCRTRSEAELMTCLRRSEYAFELDADCTRIPPLVAHFQESVSRIGLCDDNDRIRVGVALEEALVNALYHGNLEINSDIYEKDCQQYYALVRRRCQQAPYRDRRIFVKAKLSREKALFTIRDEGPGFNPASLPDPTDPANLEREGGRGVLLMRTFMDDVYYNEIGNEVTMMKRGNPATNGSP